MKRLSRMLNVLVDHYWLLPIAVVGVVLAAQVDAWVSVGCPHCGQTNAVHITQGDID